MNLVLLGPHGAGKTTTGLLLAEALDVAFHDEVGRRLASDPQWRPSGISAEAPQETFDAEVFRVELGRDGLHRGGCRVIESWHPTNLAYAARRSPAVVKRHADTIRSHVSRERCVAVLLTAPAPVLRARQTEAGDPDFFLRVGREAVAWAHSLGLDVLNPIRTDVAPPDAVVEQILTQLRSIA